MNFHVSDGRDIVPIVAPTESVRALVFCPPCGKGNHERCANMTTGDAGYDADTGDFVEWHKCCCGKMVEWKPAGWWAR